MSRPEKAFRDALRRDQQFELTLKLNENISANSVQQVEVSALSIDEGLQSAMQILNAPIEDLKYKILSVSKPRPLNLQPRPIYTILVSYKINPFIQKQQHMSQKYFQNLDGTFRISTRIHGIMLRVTSSKLNGKPVELQEVEQSIADMQIPNVDMDAVQTAINEHNGMWVKIAEYVPSEYDSTFIIEVDPDKMYATLNVQKPKKYGRIPEASEIQHSLELNGVIFGVSPHKIVEVLESGIFNRKVVVAKGQKPQHGADAYLDFNFRTGADKASFAVKDDGSINFHEINLIQSTTKGKVLAVKNPATEGIPGSTVTGQMLPAENGVDFLLQSGEGTYISQDGNAVIAERSGQISLKDRIINVAEELDIEGNVDLTTGNIDFPGNVVVHGNINDTFNVRTGANLKVNGNIGNAQIHVEGDLTASGIQGKDKGVVTCIGSLHARFIERTTLIVYGDLYIADALVYCDVFCSGSIYVMGGRRSQIVGGKVHAGKSIYSSNLGAESYADTSVEIGFSPNTMTIIKEAHQAIDSAKSELSQLHQVLVHLDAKIKQQIPLLPNEKTEYNKLKTRSQELDLIVQNKNAEIEEQQNQAESRLNNAEIGISKITYPGVRISMGKLILDIKNPVTATTFRKDSHMIQSSTYQMPKEVQQQIQEHMDVEPKR